MAAIRIKKVGADNHGAQRMSLTDFDHALTLLLVPKKDIPVILSCIVFGANMLN